MVLKTAICILLLISAASSASARPVLNHASPAAGGAVRHSPREVALSFNEALLPSRSDAVVRSATGAIVSTGKPRVVADKALLQVPVSSLPAGKYRVEWYATSTDRRQSQGSFSFVVGGDESAAKANALSSRKPRRR
jgi:copper resistance protein C